MDYRVTALPGKARTFAGFVGSGFRDLWTLATFDATRLVAHSSPELQQGCEARSERPSACVHRALRAQRGNKCILSDVCEMIAVAHAAAMRPSASLMRHPVPENQHNPSSRHRRIHRAPAPPIHTAPPARGPRPCKMSWWRTLNWGLQCIGFTHRGEPVCATKTPRMLRRPSALLTPGFHQPRASLPASRFPARLGSPPLADRPPGITQGHLGWTAQCVGHTFLHLRGGGPGTRKRPHTEERSLHDVSTQGL